MCGLGLVGKTLLHRVGISRALLSCIGLPLWGVIHPTVGPARVSTLGSRSLGSSGVHLVEVGADGTYVVS